MASCRKLRNPGRGSGNGVVSRGDCAITIRVGKNPFCSVFFCITQGKFSSIQNVSVIKIAQSRAIVRFLVEHTSYIIFHILIMGSSFLALNVQFGGFFQIFWKIFQDKGKNHQIKVTQMFGSCKVGS